VKRSKVTEKLIRIIGKIESERMPIRVKGLYVFGSYARGALDCGDLDIVLVTDRPTDEDDRRCEPRAFMDFPDYNKAFRKALKKAPSERVQIILAHEELAAGIKHMKFKPEDCVLIWNADDKWRDRIAAIAADSEAGRSMRHTYVFAKQGFGWHWEEDWAWAEDGINSGAIQLLRLPTVGFEGPLRPRIRRRHEYGMINDAMATIANIPCSYIISQGGQPDLERSAYHWLLNSKDDSIRVYLGRPKISYIRAWLCNKRVEQAYALPFLRKRKQNCLWVFRRTDGFWGYAKSKDRFLDV